ncbi:MAG TPA: four helix bundle protein [Tepidisphaeraceae bacterium]|nr:four helix bundle protein [Tepidisphaeraceae bacterium]
MAVRSYKELIVWQRAMDLVVAVYEATRTFPKEEMYGLTSQIRRCAVSVPSNLAEGQGRGTTLGFLRYTRIAMGSLQELETQLVLANRLSYMKQELLDGLLTVSDEVGRLTRGLQKSLGEPDESRYPTSN